MTKRLKIGDKVTFMLVNRRVTGVIVEDRGRIGVQGRRLWRVRVPFRDSPDMYYELPEEVIEAVSSHHAHA